MHNNKKKDQKLCATKVVFSPVLSSLRILTRTLKEVVRPPHSINIIKINKSTNKLFTHQVMSFPIMTNHLLETRENLISCGHRGFSPSRDLKSRRIIPPRLDGGYLSRLFRISLPPGVIRTDVYLVIGIKKTGLSKAPDWNVSETDWRIHVAKWKSHISIFSSRVLEIWIILLLLLSLCC